MSVGRNLKGLGFALLADASSLAVTVAHVVELGATDVTAGNNLDLFDDGRVYGEGTLYTNAEGNLTDGEGFADAATLTTNNEALEDLDTAAVTFNDVDVNVEGVTGAEVGDVGAKGLVVNEVKSLHWFSP